MRIFLVLISFVFVSMAHADVFPTFGWIKGKWLTVPSYKKVHGKVPEKLFAYGGGKEFIATLREKDSFIAAPPPLNRGCDYGDSVGDFIYEASPNDGSEVSLNDDSFDVIIFDKRMRIQDKNEGKLFIDLDAHVEWEYFRLTSSEGGHSVWRVKENGKCVAHIDNYMYCDYATERDSDRAFKEAMCGVRINISRTGL